MIESRRRIMEDFRFRRCFFMILCPLFISVFPFLSAYTFPEKYFINCGSNSSSLFGNRTFVSDKKTAAGETVSDSDPTPESNLSAIYQTARIFKNPSYYELEIDQIGIYVVRLHFYPFSSPQNILSLARFDVVVSKVLVLSNFSVPNKTSVFKEFLVSVKDSKFRVEFNPQESSFAFINAIEMFVAPDNFIPGWGLSGTGENVFQVIHRINVGGSAILPGNDTLMREWVSDDRFLFSKGMAKNVTQYRKKPNYFNGGASEYDAPDYVYQTAKEGSTTGQNRDQRFNVTWSFDVEENVGHFVRLHFCNIISEVENGTKFNLYVNGGLSRLIRPQDVNPSPASPFYFDCEVESDGSGVMNISVGVLGDDLSPAAFLNGVEIMQVIVREGNSGAKKWVFVVIGGCLAVVVLAGIVLFCCLKSRRRKPGEGDGGGTEMTSVFCMSPDMNLELRVPLVEKKGELDKIIDPLLVGKIDPNSLRKFGETVEKCLQEYGVDRPNMVDVVWDLKYALQLHHSAMKRELQPEDDSRTGYSWQLPPPVFHRFPSHIMPIDRDEECEPLTDSLGNSHSSPSAVFSQLRINDARLVLEPVSGERNDDDDMKGRDIQPIIEDCYDKYFVNTENWTCADFCHAICQTVEEINTSVRSTQIRVPRTETLDRAFNNHHKGKGKKLKREEFQKILQEIIMDTGVTGIGAKDILLFLFGVPVTTLFFKQRLFPTAVPNEVFIPAVTSATVYLLAKLNKL
nr:probable receptor-like protein kinase At5g24010 [Ipomoea trifida]